VQRITVTKANAKEVVKAMAELQEFRGPGRNWMRNGGIMMWRRAYPGRGDQVPAARRLVATLLADTERADDAGWVVSELISNALIHTRSGEAGGWFGVEVMRGRLVRIAVHDLGGGGVPQLLSECQGTELLEHGRGLRGIRELAVQTGVRGDPETGHFVWAQLALGAREQVRAS
jgi:anti-sigma regulatory factor (Ser/Thr protein kinase)